MIAQVLMVIRNRLMACHYIRSFFEAHYPGSPLQSFIGMPGHEYDRDQFPFIAIAPGPEEKPAGPERRRAMKISILIGIADDTRELQDIGGLMCQTSPGLLNCMDVAELVLRCLRAQPLQFGTVALAWNGEALTDTDGGSAHPFYEVLLTLPIQVQAMAVNHE